SPPMGPRRPDPAECPRDSARNTGRNAVQWSVAWRSSNAVVGLGAAQTAPHPRRTGATDWQVRYRSAPRGTFGQTTRSCRSCLRLTAAPRVSTARMLGRIVHQRSVVAGVYSRRGLRLDRVENQGAV